MAESEMYALSVLESSAAAGTSAQRKALGYDD